MEEIQYKKLDADCFNTHSLDSFVRHQAVTECWREVDNKWVLVPNPFVENWTIEQCREVAGNIVQHMNQDQTGFGAFDGERIIGFATVSHDIFGETANYVELVCFQVSEDYRHQGIGKKLRIC